MIKPNDLKKQSTSGGSTNYSSATGHYMHYTKSESTGNVSLRMPDGEFYILHDECALSASEAKRLAVEFINRL